MNLFGPSSKEMAMKRSSDVKALADKFHADYYFGIKNVEESFMIYDPEMENSNIDDLLYKARIFERPPDSFQ